MAGPRMAPHRCRVSLVNPASKDNQVRRGSLDMVSPSRASRVMAPRNTVPPVTARKVGQGSLDTASRDNLAMASRGTGSQGSPANLALASRVNQASPVNRGSLANLAMANPDGQDSPDTASRDNLAMASRGTGSQGSPANLALVSRVNPASPATVSPVSAVNLGNLASVSRVNPASPATVSPVSAVNLGNLASVSRVNPASPAMARKAPMDSDLLPAVKEWPGGRWP
ncbi:hypothetical protein KEM60_00162 [Austwickia sp. TVS 96-490-7B]|uniref:hypothetical protein n=1 Tax=Austwickia sp. TVS 96-490-7B TaxID=2830843 RepID=UPI001C57F7BB|nr:hypothetical protein [Austwickia sp. TVS 96-490-7B]MBW3083979.1 hypothetical protein [Austwickia sp. TVS 96-490-7B]